MTTLADSRTPVLLGEIMDTIAADEQLHDPRVDALDVYDRRNGVEHARKHLRLPRTFGAMSDVHPSSFGFTRTPLRYRIKRVEEITGYRPLRAVGQAVDGDSVGGVCSGSEFAEPVGPQQYSSRMIDSAKVPGAARAYFDGGDVRGVFTEDAVVRDDGRTYVGIEEIVAWKSAVSTAFTFTQKIESVNTPGSAVVVSVKVEGDFPGSPVQLHHHFTLDGDRISALTVCP